MLPVPWNRHSLNLTVLVQEFNITMGGAMARTAKRRATARTPVDTPRRITRDAVVEEAIRLLREEGLEGLSLRRLAARLDIRAPSLYWHVPDKSALLAAVLERLFTDCLEQVPDHRRWRDWMRDFAAALWNTQESVRDFSLLLISAPMGESQVKRVERMLTTRLQALDLPVAECLQVQGSVQVLVTGWFIFAHSRFSAALARRMDFRVRAMRDLEFLLEGRRPGAGRRRRRR